MATATHEAPRITPHRRRRSDYELARAASRGDVRAFEALYERHHLGLLSFARHMLGRAHDAEDVVQHTFLAADAALRRGQNPAAVRAWLYTVARNRCISVIRARRNDRELPELDIPSTENLAREIEQREDLRELLADLRTLPDDQRAALLMAELGDLSHAEVAQVIGVRAAKVKALVFQARQTLMAVAAARAIPCRAIQEELAVATGATRRRRHLRDHTARCAGCRAYAERVAAQRASLAAILPVIPTVALRDGVLASLSAGGATAATGGASAGLGLLAAKSTAAKLLAITALGGAAAGGGTVAISSLEPSRQERAAARAAEPPRATAAPAADVSLRAPAEPARTPHGAGSRPSDPSPRARARKKRERARSERAGARNATEQNIAHPAIAARNPEPVAGGQRTTTGRPESSRGLALGHDKQEAHATPPRGRGPDKPERAGANPLAPPKPPGPRAPNPARGAPAAQDRPETPKARPEVGPQPSQPRGHKAQPRPSDP